MADVEITRSHSLGLDEAGAAVERVAGKLENELGVTYHWTGNTLHFDGEGAEGFIEVSAESIEVAIDLPLFLQPLRGRVKSEAEGYLDREL